MDINQYIDNFLQGQPDHHDFVLAREGPSIIDPVLRRSIPNLQIIGGPLAAILRKTAAQKEIDAATKVALPWPSAGSTPVIPRWRSSVIQRELAKWSEPQLVHKAWPASSAQGVSPFGYHTPVSGPSL
jgi:hypothetical protein